MLFFAEKLGDLCVKQRSASPTDIVVAGDSQKNGSEVPEPLFLSPLCHHAVV